MDIRMKEKALRIFEICTGIAALASAGALLYETITLYTTGLRTGEPMYSRLSVRQALSEISIVFFIFLVLALLTRLLRAFYPGKDRTGRTVVAAQAYYARKCLNPDNRHMRDTRNGIHIGLVLILSCSAIYAGRKAFSPALLSGNALENEIAAYLPTVFHLLASTVFFSAIGVYLLRRYDVETLESAKSASRRTDASESHRLAFLRILILLIAAAFIVIGIMNGGLYDVYVKAINICSECIGLG